MELHVPYTTSLMQRPSHNVPHTMPLPQRLSPNVLYTASLIQRPYYNVPDTNVQYLSFLLIYVMK